MNNTSRRLVFITLHPSVIAAYSSIGIFKAAIAKNIIEVGTRHLRDFACDKHGTVDGHPYGGGDSMILRADVLAAALDSIPGKKIVLYTAPAGQSWRDDDATELAESLMTKDSDAPNFFDTIVFICGRFGGIDQRFVDSRVDREYCVGDAVVSGGELPSLMIADAILRKIPGVLGNFESAMADSFTKSLQGRLECPQYTRPAVFDGVEVPQILCSGDHDAIAKWREQSSNLKTKMRRPELL